MKFLSTILMSFVIPFLLNAQTPCNDTCKNIVDVDTGQSTGDLNCTLPNENANMRIIAEDVFKKDGTLKTYFGTVDTVCEVLGWMNKGAEKFSEVGGMVDDPYTKDITLKIKTVEGQRVRSGGYVSEILTFDSDSLFSDLEHPIIKDDDDFVLPVQPANDGNEFAEIMQYTVVHEFFHYAQDQEFSKIDKRLFTSVNSWVNEGTARMFEDIVYDEDNPYTLVPYATALDGDSVEDILKSMSSSSKSSANDYRTFVFWKLMQHRCKDSFELPLMLTKPLINFNKVAESCKDVPDVNGDKLAGAFVLYNHAMILHNNLRLIEGGEPSSILGINKKVDTIDEPAFQQTLDLLTHSRINITKRGKRINVSPMGNTLKEYSAKSFLISHKTLVSCDDINLTLEGKDVKLRAIRISESGESFVNDGFSLDGNSSESRILTKKDKKGSLFITVTNTTGSSVDIKTLSLHKEGIVANPVSMVDGAINVTLSWTCASNIDMDLTMKGPRNIVRQDVKDVKNLGLEHVYVKSSYQILRGDLFTVNAVGDKVEDSELEDSDLEQTPIRLYAILTTPSGRFFEQYEAKSLEQLKWGDFAEISVPNDDGIIRTEWKCPALNNAAGWHNLWNNERHSFQCLQCSDAKQIELVAATYKDLWYCNVNQAWEKIKIEVSHSEYRCGKENGICGTGKNIYPLYNSDTKSQQCLTCENENNIKWSPPRYQTVYCGGSTKKNKIEDGKWYCNRNGKLEDRRMYDDCKDERKKHTCGCVPCEYIVKGMRNVLEYGPIVGASVKIVEAKEYDNPDAPVVYKGITSSDNDIYKAGIITLKAKDKEKFKDETYYVLSAKGGSDIDRDDNFIRDDNPTKNNGTIHAIIKGSDLKVISFRVNVLTEAIFQVSGGVIGNEYNSTLLETKLDDAAKKLLNTKLYPTDVNQEIVYRDVLLWAPAVDKKVLYKPYDTFVEPIVRKTYSDSPRFDESYRLIYEAYNSDAPLLEPMTLKIPEGLSNKTPIGKVVVQNDKPFARVELAGKYSEYFSIDSEGMVYIEQSSAIHNGHHYRLKMRAIDSQDREGSFVGINIHVEQSEYQVNPDSSVPILDSFETFDIDENAVEGTLVATTHFTDSNQTIIGYRLTGENKSEFSVDDQGIVRVSASAEIDYEKLKNYHFSISAYNDAGNESYPVAISVSINDVVDTPLYPLVFFTHVEENIAIGTQIGILERFRDGAGVIEHFDILSPDIPLKIDNNGSITVSDHIDFEQNKEFQFLAIAYTKYGKSNKIKCEVIIDNQEPEIGMPTLEALNITIDENISNGSKIGQLVLHSGATDIERIVLYGDNENFRVDNNGSIYVTDDATLDYEVKTSYVLGARALNNRGFGNEVLIRIGVNNVADTLVQIEIFRKSIAEDTIVGTKIGQLIFHNESTELEIETLTLEGEGNENFTLEQNGTIYLSSSANIDYEKQFSYILDAVVSHGNYSAKSEVIINILNVPENIPVLYANSLNIEENATVGTIVGHVDESISGDSLILSYTLDDNRTFIIDKKGLIKVNETLDYETQNRYILTVTATNKSGESNPVTIIVNITNIADGEPILIPAEFSIVENSKVNAIVGEVAIDTVGASEIIEMILTGGDSEHFIIDNNGTIRVSNMEMIDYERRTSYSLKARASNSIGQSSWVKIIINVIDDTSHLDTLRWILNEKCMVGNTDFDSNFNSQTGIYTGDIRCNQHNITDEDLWSFEILNGVEGSLYLDEHNLTTVEGLKNLNYVSGNLFLNKNKFTNLDGLSKLTHIGGIFKISDNMLASIEGLRNLTYIDGRFYFYNNPNLLDITPLKQVATNYQRDMFIDVNQYSEKVEDNQSFCRASWQIRSENHSLVSNGMLQICIDSEAPSVRLVGANPFYVKEGTLYEEEGVTTSDTFDSNITVRIEGEVDIHNIGSYTITYTATDSSGNMSESIERTVVVQTAAMYDDTLFKGVLASCGISSEVFDTKFNSETGVYDGSIDCNSANLSDSDISHFKVLKVVKGNLELSGNQLHTLDGLDQLESIDGRLSLHRNSFTHLNSLQQLRFVGEDLILDYNPNLIDISGLSEVVGRSGRKIYIDQDQYSVKADGNMSFCRTAWSVKSLVSGSLNMLQVCSDTQVPTIILNGDNPVYLSVGTPYIDAGVIASDLLDDNITVMINGEVDTNTSGTYVLTYTATDSVGDSASISRMVIVQPTIEAFKTVLAKCGISSEVFDTQFNSETGVYTGSINCGRKNLTDADLNSFRILKEVSEYLYLNDNYLTMLQGLSSLKKVGFSLTFSNNHLVNVDGLENLRTIGSILNLASNQLENLNGLGRLSIGDGIYLYSNSNLINVSGLSRVVGQSGNIIIIDKNQYIYKADGNMSFCRTEWNIKDRNYHDIDSSMLQVCEGQQTPTITLKGDNPAYIREGEVYIESGVRAIDLLDSNVTVTTQGTVDISTVGSYILTYMVTDSDGEYASVERTVIVQTTEAYDVTLFTKVLGKCGISAESVESNFDKDTGIYTGTLACNGKGFNDEDILHLHVLKQIVTGNLLLSENNITNVAGLSSLERIEGYLDLSNNPQLLNLTGLENLIYLKGFLNVTHSPNLTDISAVSNATQAYNYYSAYIDDSQYTVKADGNASFCQSLGRVRNENLENVSKLQVCKDTQAPSITLQGDNPLIIGTGSVYEEAGVITSDVLDENITVTIEGDVDTSTLGTYTLSYTATDTSGNHASTIRTVKVEDVNVHQFRNTLRNKCGINTATFDANFNPPTGFYNENIWCDGKGLTDVDLDTFSVLKETGHDIYINNNTLTHLNGLANLVTIGSGLYVYDNPLENIIGLSNLESVGTNISLFKTNLTNLDGLEKLVNLGDGLYAYNIKLQNIDALANLESVGTNLSLFDNNLSNVNGLTSLITVGKGIYIYGNQLENINGLSSLESVGTNLVLGGNKLTNLDALSSLTHVGDGIYLWYNQLTNIDGLQGITHVDYSIDINHNVLRNVDGLTNLVSVGDGLYLHHNQLENVDGLSSLESVGGHLLLLDNNLTSVDGLSSLTSVGYTLSLRLNPNLTDISGLANLQGKEGQKIEIDLDQYMIKVDYNEAFCSKTWNIWDTDLVDIVDDMGLVCE